MKIKHVCIAALATLALATTAQAQVKVGANPGTITTNGVLDVEGTSGSRTVILQNGNMGVNNTTPGSTLNVAGSFGATYKSVSPGVALNGTDFYVAVNTTTATDAITLPPALAVGSGNFQGRVYNIKNTGTGSLSVVANGSELLDNQSGAGVASITLPAGYYAMIISKGTTSGTTWEVAIVGNSNAACTPAYAYGTVAGDGQVLNNTINNIYLTPLANNNITPQGNGFNFILKAGNTYELEASCYFSDYVNGSSGYAQYYWVDITSAPGTQIGKKAQVLSVSATYAQSQQQIARVIVTPTSDMTVGLQAIAPSGNATFSGTFSNFIIKQLNSCGGSGIVTSGSSTTSTVDYDWVRASDSQVPTNPADISGAIKRGGAANQDVSVVSTLSETGAGNYAEFNVTLGNTSDPIKGNFFANNASGTGRTVGIQAQSADPLVFRTTPSSTTIASERVRVTPAGYVGINTTNPKSILSNTDLNVLASDAQGINGNSLTWAVAQGGFAGSFYNGGTGTNSNGLSVKVASTSAIVTAFDVSQNAGQELTGNPLFTVKGNGNVGVGVVSPTAKLQIIGSPIPNTGGVLVTASALTSGNLFLGTANVNGTEMTTEWFSSQRNQTNFFASHPAGTAAGAGFMQFAIGGTAIGLISQNGTTGVTYGTTSDMRLKENIKATHFGLADLMKIQVADYNYKTDKNSAQTGFLAQQLYKIYPNAVTVGGEDASKNPWSVDYGKVTPLLVKSTQELNARVESQNVRIETLEKENKTLKAQLAEVAELKLAMAEMRQELVKVGFRKVNATGSRVAKR